jgi:hypothetical protein
MSLVPVPAEQSDSTCANCGATLLADQRYCLECGQPASPVRLAFLDVLESEQGTGGSQAISPVPVSAGYANVYDAPGPAGWLRRNNGVLTLLAVLALCLIAGLLIGHWATGKQAPAAPTTIKVEGLQGAAAAAPTSGTASTPTATPTESTKSSGKEEAEAAKAAAKETPAEKAPPPAPKKVSKTELQKLSSTSGKKHHEEIEAHGAEPIETG